MKTFLLSLCLAANGFALGQARYVETANASGSFPLVRARAAAAVYVDPADHAGVMRAAGDLVADVARVTGSTPALAHDEKSLGANALIAGTIGKSALIDRLIREGKIDASPIRGKWEAFLLQVVANRCQASRAHWSSPAATSAARSTASTISPNRSAFRPGIFGRTCRWFTKTPCS